MTTEIKTVVTNPQGQGREKWFGKGQMVLWDVGNGLFLDLQYGYIGVYFYNWLLYCVFYAIFTFYNECYFIT